MSKTVRAIVMSIGLLIVASMLLMAVVIGYRMRPIETPCTRLTYIIEDRDERMYLTESELNNLLQEENIHPVGKLLDRGMLHRIEKTVRLHPMVRTAECYTTPRGEVRVRLTQRIPVLRVQKPGDAYLIDTDRKVMQARAAVRDSMLVVSGAVGVQMASHQLTDFALWLQHEPYWRQRIRRVYVQSPHMVYLYLRDPQQPRIVLGGMNRYEQKLAKLRTFFDKGVEAIQDKQYTEWDVRFRGQVIGRY